jgi:hypothetical protein
VPNGVGVSLARKRRSPKRSSEPRPSGVHPEEGAVGKKVRSYLALCRVMKASLLEKIGLVAQELKVGIPRRAVKVHVSSQRRETRSLLRGCLDFEPLAR